ncbi:hypothetical protein [Hyphomicrobium sp. DY-1]|uniref:hypothetical protein n=1 Tax=Hyphomicrobium sp. DY-1 TaxID=3075650 RepID=UPI0039C17D8B
MALEASAGADTVNSSQIGINAKLDASNAITTAGLNYIFNCGKDGKFFDSVHGICITVDEQLAKKIATCTTAHAFYNQGTDKCDTVVIPPDESTNVANILACAKQGKVFNGTACVAFNGSKPKLAYTKNVATSVGNNVAKASALGVHDLCIVTNHDYGSGKGRGGCFDQRSPGASRTGHTVNHDGGPAHSCVASLATTFNNPRVL